MMNIGHYRESAPGDYKYEVTKQHSDEWREPSNLVYYTNRTRVTKKSPKYKGYMQKIGYKALRKAIFKTHHKR